MVARLVRAVVYCLIVLVVAWIITIVVSVLPLGPVSGIANTIIWAIAGLICLVALIHVFFPTILTTPEP